MGTAADDHVLNAEAGERMDNGSSVRTHPAYQRGEHVTRVEALQAADEFVAKILTSTGSSGRFNGTPNLAERVDLTLRVARFLLEGQPASEADDLLKREMRDELDQVFPPLRTT